MDYDARVVLFSHIPWNNSDDESAPAVINAGSLLTSGLSRKYHHFDLREFRSKLVREGIHV